MKQLLLVSIFYLPFSCLSQPQNIDFAKSLEQAIRKGDYKSVLNLKEELKKQLPYQQAIIWASLDRKYINQLCNKEIHNKNWPADLKKTSSQEIIFHLHEIETYIKNNGI